MRAGDILILVRRRDPFTTPMIRELKRLGVPVAGADRMKFTDQLAVQDLVALADFLLMPDDDLTLAVVLKSPLFGFDDDDLFALAHARNGSLWSALRERRKTMRASPKPSHCSCAGSPAPTSCRLTNSSPNCSAPTGSDCARAMLTRLGPEAAEAIDEFLDARARLRPRRRTLVARLRQPTPRGRRRDQARHGARPRRGPHHDGARREGPAGADRVPAGHLHAAAAARRAALSAAARRRADRTRSAISFGRPPAFRSSPASRTARLRRTGPSGRNITGCSMLP